MEYYDTGRIDADERMAFWVETVSKQILPAKIDPRQDSQPRAAMSCGNLGELGIREVAGGNHIYRRDENDIRHNDPQTVQVGIPSRGSSILVQDGREAVLTAGDLVIYDSSRPFTLVMEERFHWHVFLLPKHKLRRPDSELRSLTALAMRGDSGVPGVVSHFLLGLASRRVDVEDDPAAPALGENAADLIATLVRSQFGLAWSVDDPNATLRQHVLFFITQHHHDPGLDPRAIAAAIGVSVRALHLLFADTDATVMERLRRHRLAEAHRELSDPRLAHRSIGQVAAAHGIANPTVFARSFKATYGITARELRTRTTSS